jgi:hypothetical protein
MKLSEITLILISENPIVDRETIDNYASVSDVFSEYRGKGKITLLIWILKYVYIIHLLH